MTPMSVAAHGAMNAQGAVTATSPASIPLHVMEMSGLPHLAFVQAIAATAPAEADNSVFTAMSAMRRSVAPNVEPGLKPIQPKVSTSVPITT